MADKLNIVILAAGKGTRMQSKKLKVLQPLAGSTVIEQVLATSQQLCPDKIIVVYGHLGEQLQAHLHQHPLTWVHQNNPQGTGHAMQLALPHIDKDAKVLVLVGDAPLIEATDLKKLRAYPQALLTAHMPNPYGYGRIVLDQNGLVEAVIEQKDATLAQQKITQINAGIIFAGATDLANWLACIDNNNAQGELYLTDVLALAHAQNKSFHPVTVAHASSIKGINDFAQLAECEAIKQKQIRQTLMSNGVHLIDPHSVHIRGNITTGKDISVDAGVIFSGDNSLEDDVSIGAYCQIHNCQLGAGTRIASHCILDGVITQGECDIGPYARLRAGTTIGKNAKVGNFVETKKAQIGSHSKASHLSYLGDCEIGDNVNIGAGTITCNYDGVNKFTTIIEDDVFIGSDTQLIAPVTVGKGATIGAGTTLCKNAAAGKLTLSRAKQTTIEGWHKPQKK